MHPRARSARLRAEIKETADPPRKTGRIFYLRKVVQDLLRYYGIAEC